jgi:hypothetical protein
MTRMRLAKLSVCQCGFPLLDESIPLGTEYLINEQDRDTAIFTCGGCNKTWCIKTVYVYYNGKKQGGHMPSEVLEEL